MAQVQTPAVAAPSIRPARPESIVILAFVSLVLVAAIAVALVASGTLAFRASPRAGDVGSPEWVTFRAGEREPLPAVTINRDSVSSGAMVDFRRCEREGC